MKQWLLLLSLLLLLWRGRAEEGISKKEKIQEGLLGMRIEGSRK